MNILLYGLSGFFISFLYFLVGHLAVLMKRKIDNRHEVISNSGFNVEKEMIIFAPFTFCWILAEFTTKQIENFNFKEFTKNFRDRINRKEKKLDKKIEELDNIIKEHKELEKDDE